MSFGTILPGSIVYAEQAGAFLGSPLPEEAACLRPETTPGRRQEFAAGRACARRALQQVLEAPSPVLATPAGVPVWPPGLTGSITHTQGFCAAAVARKAHWLAIGIDAESHQTLSPGAIQIVCTRWERQAIVHSSCSSFHAECVIFSIKESVFKALYSLLQIWIDFQDVEVELYPRTNSFKAHWLRAPAHAASATWCAGRFTIQGTYVLSAVYL